MVSKSAGLFRLMRFVKISKNAIGCGRNCVVIVDSVINEKRGDSKIFDADELPGCSFSL